MRIWTIAPLTLAVLAAGCGETNLQRGLTGAGGGALIGFGVGGPIGALAGAGLGAAGGVYREPLVAQSDTVVGQATNTAKARIEGASPVSSTAAAQPAAPQRPPAAVARADLTNEEVREAQTALKEMGLFEDEVDGMYGPRTISAVREFQTQQDIRQTGALDRQTKQKLQIAAQQGGTPGSSPGSSDVEQTAEEPEKSKPGRSEPTTP